MHHATVLAKIDRLAFELQLNTRQSPHDGKIWIGGVKPDHHGVGAVGQRELRTRWEWWGDGFEHRQHHRIDPTGVLARMQ